MFGMCLKSLIVRISIFRVRNVKLSVAQQLVPWYVLDKQSHDAHDHQCIEGFALQTTEDGKWKPLKKVLDSVEIGNFFSQLNIPLIHRFGLAGR